MTITEEHLSALVEEISQPIISSVREMLNEMQVAQLAFKSEIDAQNRIAHLKVFDVQLNIDLAIQISLEAINQAGLLNQEADDSSRRMIFVALTKSSEAMLLEAQRQAVAEDYSEILEELARRRDVFLTDLQKRLVLIT